MHIRLLVTLKAPDAEKAREEAFWWCSEHLQEFGADWFVVGGRWSGILSLAQLDEEKLKAFSEEAEQNGLFYPGHEEELKTLFKKYFPDFREEIPFLRSPYNLQGNADDVQLVNQKIYDALLKPYEGEEKVEEDGDLFFIDLDGEKVNPGFVGTKYLVVVDYHI